MILILISLFDINLTNIDRMKYSEVERKLTKYGCTFLRDGKKHPIWYSPITGNEFQLSHHKSEEVKYGTLKSISKESGIKL
jgi:mRNA interferase HicA